MFCNEHCCVLSGVYNPCPTPVSFCGSSLAFSRVHSTAHAVPCVFNVLLTHRPSSIVTHSAIPLIQSQPSFVRILQPAAPPALSSLCRQGALRLGPGASTVILGGWTFIPESLPLCPANFRCLSPFLLTLLPLAQNLEHPSHSSSSSSAKGCLGVGAPRLSPWYYRVAPFWDMGIRHLLSLVYYERQAYSSVYLHTLSI